MISCNLKRCEEEQSHEIFHPYDGEPLLWYFLDCIVIALSGLKFYIIVCLAILYHHLYCNFIPVSVLFYYTYIWIGTLYHCLGSNIIPLSVLDF